MMPVSRRRTALCVSSTASERPAPKRPRLQALATRLLLADSSALAIGIASSFLLLSAAMSFAPERGVAARPPSPAALGLRGSLPITDD